MNIHFVKTHSDAVTPSTAYRGDAGFDLASVESCMIPPGGISTVSTGIAMAMPDNLWCHILPRSSTLRRYNLLVVPAVIDSGYRGELYLQVANLGVAPIIVSKGVRLAQCVFHEIPNISWSEVRELPGSDRGTKGFGSSGE